MKIFKIILGVIVILIGLGLWYVALSGLIVRWNWQAVPLLLTGLLFMLAGIGLVQNRPADEIFQNILPF